ncbi:hypothetical protein ANN_26724 [Periplaneta americana]|uniref:Uncharacterized protein n=1 Tax=Periplaneta americana TaxID=6978 RepID=A0ABQ8RZ15_PERAM|nr:hypothetical protein ANN_26724 [Periplaneta americana]
MRRSPSASHLDGGEEGDRRVEHDIGSHQQADSILRDMIARIKNGEIIPVYKLKGEILVKRGQCGNKYKIVLPHALVPAVFSFYHVSEMGGHLGRFKTYCDSRETISRPAEGGQGRPWLGGANEVARASASWGMCCGVERRGETATAAEREEIQRIREVPSSGHP